MYYELIVFGIVCLVAPWVAGYVGYEMRRKPFDLVGVAGIFFLLAASFGLGMNLIPLLTHFGQVFMIVSFVLGWVAMGVGAIWTTIEIIREPEHDLPHKGALRT